MPGAVLGRKDAIYKGRQGLKKEDMLDLLSTADHFDLYQ